MLQITVGYIAGLIAALFFIGKFRAIQVGVGPLGFDEVNYLVSILTPTALTFVLSGLLSDTNSAATWCVGFSLVIVFTSISLAHLLYTSLTVAILGLLLDKLFNGHIGHFSFGLTASITMVSADVC